MLARITRAAAWNRTSCSGGAGVLAVLVMAACGSSGSPGQVPWPGSGSDGASAAPSDDASSGSNPDDATVGTGTGDASTGTGTMDSTVATGPNDGSGTSNPTDVGTIPALDGSIGAAQFAAGDLDPPSHGGTITFQNIGAAGSYGSMRDPAKGPCDAKNVSGCCLATNTITSDALTPWDQDLIVTLRAPMLVKQLVVYQPAGATPGAWDLVSSWDSRSPQTPKGIAFSAPFTGAVNPGAQSLIDVSTDKVYACGPGGAVPYCPPASAGKNKYYGWAGSKLFVVLAKMPHLPPPYMGGWWDASWIGLNPGELQRAVAFGTCNCFSAGTFFGGGCGQFNAFEIINDGHSTPAPPTPTTYTNLDVYSADFTDYCGVYGQGPPMAKCNAAAVGPAVDLIDKSCTTESAVGAVGTQGPNCKGNKLPGGFLRRQANGYRYMIILLDVATKQVQLGLVHPQSIPASIADLLPNLPPQIPQTTIANVLALRLPH